MTVNRLIEGSEITTHQRILDGKPPVMTDAGVPAYPTSCGGIMRVQAYDTGRGPVIVECDECGVVRGLARRDPNATPPLLVGAGVDDDGYTKF